jgi:hypothetical protein
MKRLCQRAADFQSAGQYVKLLAASAANMSAARCFAGTLEL